MTDNDKDQIIGTAMRDHKRASEQVALLRTKASKIGETYLEIGNGLKGYPEGVYRHRDSIDGRFGIKTVAADPATNVTEVLAITEELRTTIIKQQELAEQLERLGFPQC
jgi:hypothetical protein